MVLEYFYPIDSYKIQNGNNWRETRSILENNIYDVSIKEFVFSPFFSLQPIEGIAVYGPFTHMWQVSFVSLNYLVSQKYLKFTAVFNI
jgi:hypothetical protein